MTSKVRQGDEDEKTHRGLYVSHMPPQGPYGWKFCLIPSYWQMAEPLKAGLQGGLFIIGCMLPEGSTYGMVVLWRGRIALKA